MNWITFQRQCISRQDTDDHFPRCVCYRSSRTVGETCQMMTIPQTMKILHFRSVRIWMTCNLDSRRRENVFIRRFMKAGLSS